MTRTLPFLVSILLGLDLAVAQSLGKGKENHPKITTYQCTKKNGCKKQDSYSKCSRRQLFAVPSHALNHSSPQELPNKQKLTPNFPIVVLDSAMHPIYQKKHPSLGCGDWGSAPNKTVCPDAKTCNDNCVMDAISDYSAYGVKTSGSNLYLDMLRDSDLSTISPRAYLLDGDQHKYDLLKLTGYEFTFDVDVSKLPCGMNAALYLGEMDKYGGRSYLNKGGAEYGSGYCDAQCYTFPFAEGVVCLPFPFPIQAPFSNLHILTSSQGQHRRKRRLLQRTRHLGSQPPRHRTRAPSMQHHRLLRLHRRQLRFRRRVR